MKLQKLKIINIASIERAEIDFDQSPLNDDAIFLITGETGSGKTTLLNSICLALYNQVPSLEDNSKKDEKTPEDISVRDTRQLMRRGTGSAEIELTFIGNDDKHYCARWCVWRARKKAQGALQDLSREIECKEDHRTYTKIKDIESLINRVVGLTFTQFTRTTMLAQGKFATFMKAKDDEKAQILEKLTGTEIYASIGKKIFEIKGEKEREHTRLKDQIGDVKLLKEGEKEELKTQIGLLNQEISLYASRLDLIDTQIGWLKHDRELKSELASRIEALGACQAQLETEEYREEKSALMRWDGTVDLRRFMQGIAESAKSIDNINTQIGSMVDNRLLPIMGGISWLSAQLEDLKNKKKEIEDKLSGQSRFANVYSNSVRIEEAAKTIADSQKKISRYRVNKDKIDDEIEKAKTQEQRLTEEAEVALKSSTQQTELVNRFADEMKQVDVATLHGEYQKIAEAEESTKAAKEAIKLFYQSQEDYERALKEAEEANKEHDKVQLELSQVLALMPEAERIAKTNKNLVDGYTKLSENLVVLRQRFEQLHECPLCGTGNVHLHDDDKIEQDLRAAIKDLDEANEKLSDLTTKSGALKAALETHKKNIAAKQRQLSKNEKTKNEAWKNVEKLGFEVLTPDSLDVLEKALAEYGESKKVAARRIEEFNAKLKELENQRKVLDDLSKAREAAQKELADFHQKMSDRISASKQEESLAASEENRAEEALGKMQEYMGEEIYEINEVEKPTVENAQRIAKAIAILNKSHEDLVESNRQIDKECTDLVSMIEYAFEETKALKERFNMPAAEPKNLDGLQEKIRSFVRDINKLDGQIANEKDKLNTSRQRMNELLEVSPYALVEVEQIAAIGDAQITKWRDDAKLKEEALEKAKNELNVIKEQIKAHSERQPQINENDTLDGLNEAKLEINGKRDEAMTKKVQIEKQLDDDARLSSDLAAKLSQLEVLSKEYGEWALLNDMFGSSDGGRFSRVAQSYVLRALLAQANFYLGKLSPRYQLMCEDASLTINVIDSHQGNALRNVGLLSGGEGFIVSLALALGLSAISKDKIQVDTLFIDEGFGMLDQATLEQVIEVLDRLHQTSGRRIGIISHVEALKTRLTTQISLYRTGPSSSALAIKSLE